MKSPIVTSPYKEILKLIRPHWVLFIIGMIGLIGGAAINLVLPEVLRWILAPEHFHYLTDVPFLVALGLVTLFALQGIAFYIRSYLFGIIGQRAVARLRASLYNVLAYQPIEFFDRERTGELISRLGSDTGMIQDIVSIKLSVFLRYSLQVVVGIVLMLLLSFKLSIAILVTLPLLVVISLILAKRLRRFSKIQQSELARASSIAEETLGNARVVKAFNREPFEAARYQEATERTLAAGLSRTVISAFFQSFVSFLMNVTIVGVIVYGITLVNAGTMQVGDLTAFLLYGVIVAVSFAFVTGGYSEFAQGLGSVERVFELLALSSPQNIIAPLDKERAVLINKEISFDKVSFSYPNRPEATVLKNISCTFAPGKITALVGPSGAGKSTIASLLLKFYDPSSGDIKMGGTLLSTLSPYSIREAIAYVPQESVLFAAPLRENLRYGKATATDEELFEVCRKVNLEEFIKSLPEGLSTNPGDRGVQLSGGQKQRIAIARALLKDPDFLILDEATSSLDSENEALVQQALDTLMQGRTTLVIAHRLSTIRNADLVLVLDQGEIVQSGTHDSLSKTEGLYQQLVQRQELA